MPLLVVLLYYNIALKAIAWCWSRSWSYGRSEAIDQPRATLLDNLPDVRVGDHIYLLGDHMPSTAAGLC